MKKNFELVLALVLSIMMILGSVAALADTPNPAITITNTNTNISIDGKTYSAYKLFDSTHVGTAYAYTMSTSSQFYSADLLGATEPTDDLAKLLWNAFTFTAVQGDTSKVNVAPKGTFDATAARTFADAIEAFLVSPITATATGTASGETATIDLTGANAGLGYYIVTGDAKPTQGESNDTAKTVVSAVILTNENPSPVVNPKADAPGLTKKITKVEEGTTAVEGAVLDAAGKAAVAKVGSTVSYEIETTIPDLTGYDDYTYIIHDTLTSGLDYVTTSFELKIDGTTDSEIKPTFTGTGIRTFAITVPFAKLKGKSGKKVTLTYQATVNSSALNYDYENNTANLEYSHSPYDDDTNHTPDQKTYVIDLNLDVIKVDGKNTATKLKDAEFKLYKVVSETKYYYKWDTTNNKVTWTTTEAEGDVFKTVESTGKLQQQVRGLDKGTYYFVETKAPEGYNLLKDPIEVIISVTEASDKVTYTATYGGQNATVTNGEVDIAAAQNGNQPVAEGTIANNSGTQLPSTGGIGTTIFYVAGSILVLAAAILLITKRRMGNND